MASEEPQAHSLPDQSERSPRIPPWRQALYAALITAGVPVGGFVWLHSENETNTLAAIESHELWLLEQRERLGKTLQSREGSTPSPVSDAPRPITSLEKILELPQGIGERRYRLEIHHENGQASITGSIETLYTDGRPNERMEVRRLSIPPDIQLHVEDDLLGFLHREEVRTRGFKKP